jgi:hypothetical protein
MLFYQAAAPAGWIQDTTHNDKALRVVSGAGGGSGGSNSFSSVMAQTVVGNKTLALADLPGGIASNGSNLIYTYPAGSSNNTFELFFASGTYTSKELPVTAGSGVWVIAGAGSGNVSFTSNASGTNNLIVNSNNTGGGSHNHTITMNIQYVDMIIASRV